MFISIPPPPTHTHTHTQKITMTPSNIISSQVYTNVFEMFPMYTGVLQIKAYSFALLNIIPIHVRACFLYLAQSKLRLCSANHRPGYWSNLACDWLSIVWAYSKKRKKADPGLITLYLITIQSSQFVVVSHWPMFLGCCDLIYRNTMRNNGTWSNTN